MFPAGIGFGDAGFCEVAMWGADLLRGGYDAGDPARPALTTRTPPV